MIIWFGCVTKQSRKMKLRLFPGGADGADLLGERYAKERGYPIKRFDADWTKFGKAAGPIRNGKMAEYADYLIAFWDGKSTGTADMINQANKKGFGVLVCYLGPN